MSEGDSGKTKLIKLSDVLSSLDEWKRYRDRYIGLQDSGLAEENTAHALMMEKGWYVCCLLEQTMSR